MIRWFKKHFKFHYIGVVHLPVATDENGRMTANKPVVLFMTGSGRRKAVVNKRKGLTFSWKRVFDYHYEKQIVPWLKGGEFPKGQYKQDVLAAMLIQIIDNKLQDKENSDD